jgi:hypothetical protein
MKAKIAVATVSGKAYYMIVNELKRKNVPFLSLTPYESVPVEIKVVITTEEEKRLIHHEKILACKTEENQTAIINEALQIIEGKDLYQKVVIGVDPGEVFGLAVLAGGKVIDTGNCHSLNETLGRIETVIKGLENTSVSSIAVRIGDGVPEYKDKLLQSLDETLPPSVVLESVGEAGTDSRLNEAKHRRGLRDIVSAIQIAGRSGQVYHRRKQN